MKKYTRILVALTIFLSGVALVPVVALPSQPFDWQLFSDTYQPPPAEVSIVDFAFEPGEIIVTVGTTVRWTNEDTAPHTVTSDYALFDSGILQTGESFEFLFDTTGTFDYICTLHPSMTGTVIVVDEVFRLYLPLLSRSNG